MRRNRQALTEEETLLILERGKTGVLGVSGDGGYPYTVPINYVYHDGKVYFHCAKEGHKLDSIKRCEKVSLCVIERDDVHPEQLTTYFRSAILFGKARILETKEEIYRAAQWLGQKYVQNDAQVRAEIAHYEQALCCVEIKIDHITGKECIELRKLRDQGAEAQT